MPYIDFGGGSKQTPVKETNNSCNCDKCIHRYILSKDLFYCTITGNIKFYDYKTPFDCLYKNVKSKLRKVVIAVYHIKDDGTTSLFLSSAEKTDNDIIKLFYEKAVPDLYNKDSKTKNLTIIPIIVGEAIENNYFIPFDSIMPPYILSNIIKELNDNINNLGAIGI